ncbi:histidine phosphatase superfamily [Emericellopsis atlantica]|uniref:Histidine phosphatase superfamily n=1 Tax=Emericellopsis atlantica TaxID=2614577 RepID=A0A9P7ZMP6_9HYPO|nr:histidine phosphatase superfamily [Emericellopsis atlantica]KAG9254527.1 histidine phosphatase superfamily [Emericellopsis atlantica]
MKLSQLLPLAGLAATASASWPEAQGKSIKYTTVQGYFLQDEADTVPGTFDYASSNLGLLNRTYPTDNDASGDAPQWERFARWVSYLNRNCRNKGDVRYKVLVMGRHGEGWHNAAESFYGTPAWNCYWSVLDGNGTTVWADPLLTPAGSHEALKANAFFKSHFADHGLPYFESYYTSPLMRCTTTANLTFADIDLPETRPFDPVVKEFFREGISIHTCDRRSSKSHIHAAIPALRFEDGFTEEDELWRGDVSEGEIQPHQDWRSQSVLDDVFVEDDATWISVTSHSGEIRSLLRVLGHREFSLSTGQIIPVLVKAEVVEGTPTTEPLPGFTSEATCDAPPVTSVAGQGCVCTQTA